MSASMFLRHGLLFLAIGALAASFTPDKQDVDKQESRRIFRQAFDPKLKDKVSNEEVFQWLEKALKLHPGKKELQLLVDARDSISIPRCTIEYHMWLTNMITKNSRFPLSSYLDEIRSQSRALCSQTFKQRLQPVMAQVEPEKIKFVGNFCALLNETSKISENLYRKNDVSAVSLADAIKKYVGDKMDSGEYTSELEKERKRQQVSEALSPLLDTCTELTQKLEDFSWTLKVIERPRDLDSDMEEALWATKVCVSLRFERFRIDLHIRKEELALVERFIRLFDLPNDALLEPKFIMQRLDYLLSQRETLARKEFIFGERPELINQLKSRFGEACKSYAKAMSNLLYLVDMVLKSTELKPDKIISLNQARACEVLESISY